MQPALPKLVESPGNSESISVTRAPRRCRCQAQDDPTMPAPITTQCSPPLTGSAVAISAGGEALEYGDHAIDRLLGAVEITAGDQARQLGLA